MAMKKIPVSIIVFFNTLQLLYSADNIFAYISGDFFQEYNNVTAINGRFNIHYLVQPSDNIPYEEITIFSLNDSDNYDERDKYKIRYFDGSRTTASPSLESIIEIYGQQFPLGYLDDDHRWPRDFRWHTGEFWLFEYNGKTFLCYTASAIPSDYYNYVLLFDITDRDNVQFHIFVTFHFGYAPKLFTHDSRLYIFISDIRDDYDGYWHSRFYSLDTFERMAHEDGSEVEFVFGYDKWRNPPDFFVSSNFPHGEISMYKNSTVDNSKYDEEFKKAEGKTKEYR
jgi:hypothetical protein